MSSPPAFLCADGVTRTPVTCDNAQPGMAVVQGPGWGMLDGSRVEVAKSNKGTCVSVCGGCVGCM